MRYANVEQKNRPQTTHVALSYMTSFQLVDSKTWMTTSFTDLYAFVCYLIITKELYSNEKDFEIILIEAILIWCKWVFNLVRRFFSCFFPRKAFDRSEG